MARDEVFERELMSVNLAPFSGKHCVVTGGLGFIGSNLALGLARAGARVKVIDALVPTHGGDARNLDQSMHDIGSGSIEVVVANISDGPAVTPLIEGADFVFAIAGQVSHHESMLNPLGDLDHNTRSQVGFLELLRVRAPQAVVVHTSTRQVYGRPHYLPVDEEHPTSPVDANGIDKLAGEQYYLLYSKVHGMKISALRLTNVYGPRQCLTRDGLGFLPVFIRRALRAEPITVFGEGKQFRDCLHVDDVINALALAANSSDGCGEVFNIGHPEHHSLDAIARIIVDEACQGEVASVPWPEELVGIDIGSFHSDFSKAKRVLGWEPSIGLREGIARTLTFYREHSWYLS